MRFRCSYILIDQRVRHSSNPLLNAGIVSIMYSIDRVYLIRGVIAIHLKPNTLGQSVVLIIIKCIKLRALDNNILLYCIH